MNNVEELELLRKKIIRKEIIMSLIIISIVVLIMMNTSAFQFVVITIFLGIIITIILNIPINIIIKNLSGINNVSSLPPLAAIILIAISVFLTVVAGLIPSSYASKKDPVVSLRSE